jgi:hypothetical protein
MDDLSNTNLSPESVKGRTAHDHPCTATFPPLQALGATHEKAERDESSARRLTHRHSCWSVGGEECVQPAPLADRVGAGEGEEQGAGHLGDGGDP